MNDVQGSWKAATILWKCRHSGSILPQILPSSSSASASGAQFHKYQRNLDQWSEAGFDPGQWKLLFFPHQHWKGASPRMNIHSKAKNYRAGTRILVWWIKWQNFFVTSLPAMDQDWTSIGDGSWPDMSHKSNNMPWMARDTGICPQPVVVLLEVPSLLTLHHKKNTLPLRVKHRETRGKLEILTDFGNLKLSNAYAFPSSHLIQVLH